MFGVLVQSASRAFEAVSWLGYLIVASACGPMPSTGAAEAACAAFVKNFFHPSATYPRSNLTIKRQAPGVISTVVNTTKGHLPYRRQLPRQPFNFR